MTSVCFYSGEQKENVSCYFMVFEMNYLNGSLNLSFSEFELWHSECWKWNECLSALYLFAHLTVIAIAFLWKMSSAFRNWISEVVVIWVTWDENERRENVKEKQENRFWKSSFPFRGQSFFAKKTKTTRDNRQVSSFLIPHLNAWPEARGGFGSAADVCCLKLQIDWI